MGWLGFFKFASTSTFVHSLFNEIPRDLITSLLLRFSVFYLLTLCRPDCFPHRIQYSAEKWPEVATKHSHVGGQLLEGAPLEVCPPGIEPPGAALSAILCNMKKLWWSPRCEERHIADRLGGAYKILSLFSICLFFSAWKRRKDCEITATYGQSSILCFEIHESRGRQVRMRRVACLLYAWPQKRTWPGYLQAGLQAVTGNTVVYICDFMVIGSGVYSHHPWSRRLEWSTPTMLWKALGAGWTHPQRLPQRGCVRSNHHQLHYIICNCGDALQGPAADWHTLER